MNHLGAKRLLDLADLLESNRVKDHEFAMATWKTKVENKDEGTCGTTCCALGWACCLPKLKALGLKLVVDTKAAKWNNPEETITQYRVEVKGVKTENSLEAAEYVFDLDYEEASKLFASETYRNRFEVAKDIRKLVKQYHAIKTSFSI